MSYVWKLTQCCQDARLDVAHRSGLAPSSLACRTSRLCRSSPPLFPTVRLDMLGAKGRQRVSWADRVGRARASPFGYSIGVLRRVRIAAQAREQPGGLRLARPLLVAAVAAAPAPPAGGRQRPQRRRLLATSGASLSRTDGAARAGPTLCLPGVVPCATPVANHIKTRGPSAPDTASCPAPLRRTPGCTPTSVQIPAESRVELGPNLAEVNPTSV